MTAHRAFCLALLIATVALGSARAGCVSQTARPSDINTSALALYDLKGVYQRHIRTDSLPASFTVQEVVGAHSCEWLGFGLPLKSAV